MTGWAGSKTALLALHYQNEVLHHDGKIRLGVAADAPGRAEIVDAAGRLLAAARRAKLAVVHVRIAFPVAHVGVRTNAPIFRDAVAVGACEEGSWGADFHAGLGPLPGETVITHERVNAFFASPLEAHLRAGGATRLILAGVATNSVVEHSARHAADIGFDIAVAADACSAARADLHRAALDNIALLGRVGTVDELFSSTNVK